MNVLGYLVVTKPVRNIKNDTMYFNTFMMQKVIGLMLFAQTAMRYPFAEKGFYSMNGKVVEEFGVYIC